jgi:glycosyltransferase involved in cell wall biosynthesis
VEHRGTTPGQPAAGPTISAVVCTRNRGDRIVPTITTLLANDQPDFEVLVVDQSPGDETEEALAPFRHDQRFRYERIASTGIGPSRNYAVDAARAELIAFTDDDCAVPEDWLSTIVRLFGEHPTIGMLYCNVKPAPYDPSLGFVPTYERPGDHLVDSMIAKCRGRGIGAGMAMRRSIVQSVGNFDATLGADFPGVVGEEGDLTVRVILNGHPVLETDQTYVVHDGFRTWQQGKDLTRRNFIGIGLVCCKPLRCGHLRAIVVVLYEGVVVALGGPLRSLLRGRPPRGLRAFWFFWVGFVRGLRHPIDKRTMCYVPAAERRPRARATKNRTA